MKKLLVILVVLNCLFGTICASPEVGNDDTKALVHTYYKKVLEDKYDKKIKVRVTVYWSQGSGTDYWSAKGISSTGEKLVQGKSAAVDPRIFPYGSKINIPALNKKLIAKDTGSAIIARTASRKEGKNLPVIDVYFKKKEDALRFANSNPRYVWAYVTYM